MMMTIWIIVAWLAYGSMNVFFAEWNNMIRVDRIRSGDKRQINHPLWAAFYCVLCAPMYWCAGWWFLGSILLLHLGIFPVAYNRAADLPAFNLSKTTTAWSDRIMAKIGLHSTEAVNIGAFILSIGLLIKTIA